MDFQQIPLQVPNCENVIRGFQEHWGSLRSQALNQDITVISVLVTIMLLLHYIAYNK